MSENSIEKLRFVKEFRKWLTKLNRIYLEIYDIDKAEADDWPSTCLLKENSNEQLASKPTSLQEVIEHEDDEWFYLECEIHPRNPYRRTVSKIVKQNKQIRKRFYKLWPELF